MGKRKLKPENKKLLAAITFQWYKEHLRGRDFRAALKTFLEKSSDALEQGSGTMRLAWKSEDGKNGVTSVRSRSPRDPKLGMKQKRVRVHVDLKARLVHVKQISGCSMAEIVRRAVDGYYLVVAQEEEV